MLPFIGNVPGLGPPARLTFTATSSAGAHNLLSGDLISPDQLDHVHDWLRNRLSLREAVRQ